MLPVDDFGSYSCGYHVINAILTWGDIDTLNGSIRLMTFGVYPITLLGYIFLLNVFTSETKAIYIGLIYFAINSIIVNSLSWGGNPHTLAFGFSLFIAGLIIRSFTLANWKLLLLAAPATAAIPLIHAIPAVVCAYLVLPIAVYFCLIGINRNIPSKFILCYLALVVTMLIHL
jgi:hypothetical protein